MKRFLVGFFILMLVLGSTCLFSKVQVGEEVLERIKTQHPYGCYCESSGEKQIFEWIAGVEVVGSFNNTSGPSGYSNFTYMVACLPKNGYVSVTLTPGFEREPCEENWRIWIDYNQDCDFSDDGELVFFGTSPEQVGAFLDGSFTVPPSALTGYTRMRVSMSYYEEWPPDCETFEWGEVEDYTVYIFDKPPPVGNTTVYEYFSNHENRRAMPFTMPEDGTITSVAMYHLGGSGDMIFGVYDGEGSPQHKLGGTEPTEVNSTPGWQEIGLDCPAFVAGGTTVWLAWVYESTPMLACEACEDGTPGVYDASVGWPGGMPDLFGSGTQEDYCYSIKAYYTPTCVKTVGNTTVFESTSIKPYRRAMPFTMPENGYIHSVTMYHLGGSDDMILAVYDGEVSPQRRLRETVATPVSDCTGWQTIELTSSAYVADGVTVWLAWCYESNPGIKYQTGLPGRFQSEDTGCSGGMPDPFGNGSQAPYIYSIYATYTPQYTLTTNVEGNGTVTLNPPGGTYPEGTVVTLTATPYGCWQFDGWSGHLNGMENPTTITMDSDKTVTATFAFVGLGGCSGTGTVGNTTVFARSSTSAYRRAMPFTMPENGEICSVTMFHNGGSGDMILAVYDGEGTPQNRLAISCTAPVSGSAGWQTLGLISPSPPYVAAGSTVWLAWVYEDNPGIRYQTGSRGSFQSTQTWSGGMPDPFGPGIQAPYIYSIYATYIPD